VTKSTGDEWLGVPALAKQLGVTIPTLYRILDSGTLPAYKIGWVIRIQRVDVEAFRERTKGGRGKPRHIRQPVWHSRASPRCSHGEAPAMPPGDIRPWTTG
jgi:excisionase family DNA binding protein